MRGSLAGTDVKGLDGHAFVVGSINRHKFRFAEILDWIRQHIKPLVQARPLKFLLVTWRLAQVRAEIYLLLHARKRGHQRLTFRQ